MTPDQFAAKMQALQTDGDLEGKHGDEDKLMCEVLESLGYSEGVRIFNNGERWYA